MEQKLYIDDAINKDLIRSMKDDPCPEKLYTALWEHNRGIVAICAKNMSGYMVDPAEGLGILYEAVIRSLKTYDIDKGSYFNYLYNIYKSRCLLEYNRFTESYDDVLLDDKFDFEVIEDDLDSMVDLRMFAGLLKDSELKILDLRFNHGYSQVDIAELMGESKQVVSLRLKKIIEKIKKDKRLMSSLSQSFQFH